MNQLHVAIVQSRVKAAVEAALALDSMSHGGLKGQIRELLITDLIRPLLPPTFGVGHGLITTAWDQVSREQDIIIYDRSILPPILYERNIGLFPVESVLFSVEVKSCITAGEIRSANTSAKDLLELKYHSGKRDESGHDIPHEGIAAVSTLFALRTDLSEGGLNELQRYMKIEREVEPPIRAICVVGRGYWLFVDSAWQSFQLQYPYSEVIAFLVGMLNYAREAADTRGKPDLQHYLL